MISLSFPFKVVSGAIGTTTNYDEIVRGQVLDCVSTSRFERVMRPDYGVDAQSILFDPSSLINRNDTAGYIQQRLATQVTRATITNVASALDPISPNLVYIKIDYSSVFIDSSLVVAISPDSTGSSSSS